MSNSLRTCIRCKAMIPQGRIEALPETQLCIKCSEEVGSDFETRVVSENLAKEGSMKKNYGGVGHKKRRRNIQPLEEMNQ